MVRAWLPRVNPLEGDRVPVALRTGEASVGWGKAAGLTDPTLSRWRSRSIVVDAYQQETPDLRRAGGAAGQLGRFIREMQDGDLAVVPHVERIHLALAEHYAHGRPVGWLTGPGQRGHVAWLGGAPHARSAASA